MTDLITSDAVFSASEVALLEVLAELMIPGSGNAPSAADADIFALIVKRLMPSAQLVHTALSALEASAQSRYHKAFDDLSPTDQLALTDSTLDQGFKAVFQMQVVTSYYEDSRAMLAVGLPPRPAFPEGYEVTDSNWDLVEPVRARGPIYRQPPG
jgi:hypothetical protein